MADSTRTYHIPLLLTAGRGLTPARGAAGKDAGLPPPAMPCGSVRSRQPDERGRVPIRRSLSWARARWCGSLEEKKAEEEEKGDDRARSSGSGSSSGRLRSVTSMKALIPLFLAKTDMSLRPPASHHPLRRSHSCPEQSDDGDLERNGPSTLQSPVELRPTQALFDIGIFKGSKKPPGSSLSMPSKETGHDSSSSGSCTPLRSHAIPTYAVIHADARKLCWLSSSPSRSSFGGDTVYGEDYDDADPSLSSLRASPDSRLLESESLWLRGDFEETSWLDDASDSEGMEDGTSVDGDQLRSRLEHVERARAQEQARTQAQAMYGSVGFPSGGFEVGVRASIAVVASSAHPQPLQDDVTVRRTPGLRHIPAYSNLARLFAADARADESAESSAESSADDSADDTSDGSDETDITLPPRAPRPRFAFPATPPATPSESSVSLDSDNDVHGPYLSHGCVYGVAVDHELVDDDDDDDVHFEFEYGDDDEVGFELEYTDEDEDDDEDDSAAGALRDDTTTPPPSPDERPQQFHPSPVEIANIFSFLEHNVVDDSETTLVTSSPVVRLIRKLYPEQRDPLWAAWTPNLREPILKDPVVPPWLRLFLQVQHHSLSSEVQATLLAINFVREIERQQRREIETQREIEPQQQHHHHHQKSHVPSMPIESINSRRSRGHRRRWAVLATVLLAEAEALREALTLCLSRRLVKVVGLHQGDWNDRVVAGLIDAGVSAHESKWASFSSSSGVDSLPLDSPSLNSTPLD